MPKAKTWICQICDNLVSEVGSYAKLSLGKYAHSTCYWNKALQQGFEAGRQQVLSEQREAASRKAEQERIEYMEREARERAEADRRAEIAERERTNRIQAALNNPLPPKLEPKRAEPAKEEAPKPDRFQIIDLD